MFIDFTFIARAILRSRLSSAASYVSSSREMNTNDIGSTNKSCSLMVQEINKSYKAKNCYL